LIYKIRLNSFRKILRKRIIKLRKITK